MARIDTLKNFLTDVADKLREKLGTTDEIQHSEFDAKIDEVYEAGKIYQTKTFWDNYQQMGERKNYDHAFAGVGWSDDFFKPEYVIVPERLDYTFAESKITEIKDGVIDTTNCVSFERPFRYSKIKELSVINTSSCNDLTYLFYYAVELQTIEKLIFSSEGSQVMGSGTFSFCTKLKDINEIQGQIGRNKLTLYTSSTNNCNNLTKETLVRILNALMDKSDDLSENWVVTLGSVNLNKLTSEEKQIATNKGWSLV